MVVERTPKLKSNRAPLQPKNGRVVLPADEFAGLCHIVANPEPPTPEARAAWAEYRRMQEQSATQAGANR